MMRKLMDIILNLFGITFRSTVDVEAATNEAVGETQRLAEALDDINKKPDPFATLVHNMRGSSFRSRASKGQL